MDLAMNRTINRAPTPERLVHSEFTDRLVPIGSEAWRHECEVAFFLGLPLAKREQMLEGTSDGTDPGVKGTRGETAVAMLRKEIARLGQIRSSRIGH
jgi:hypothetical protein